METKMSGGDSDSLAREVGALRARVAEAEQTSRRWRHAGLGLGLVLALFVLSGQSAAPRTLEAGAILVRDPDSRARLQLIAADGEASLALHDAEGHLRASITNEAEGPLFSLYGASGNPRLVVGQRGGAAFVIVRDADGAPRAAIAVQETGEPSLYLLDENLDPIFREPSGVTDRD
jgi:hypothetical protein